MRIALADDSGIFREALSLVMSDLGWQVLISAASGAELLAALERTAVDVVLLDVAMPPTRTSEGIEVARAIKKTRPELGVLLLSAHAATPQAIALLREINGAVGYLQKDEVANMAELRGAIERVRRGDVVVDRSLVRRLLQAPARESQLARLSEQERQVLRLMAEGYSNAGVALQLLLSERTVEDHAGRIFTKLDISGRDSSSNKRVLAVLTWLRLTGGAAPTV